MGRSRTVERGRVHDGLAVGDDAVVVAVPEAFCSRVVKVEGCQGIPPSQEPPRKVSNSKLFTSKA